MPLTSANMRASVQACKGEIWEGETTGEPKNQVSPVVNRYSPFTVVSPFTSRQSPFAVVLARQEPRPPIISLSNFAKVNVDEKARVSPRISGWSGCSLGIKVRSKWRCETNG
ncbi:MAG: hypothetical protein DFNUSKGM_002370 [Candidatus Fervidibacter sacchari]